MRLFKSLLGLSLILWTSLVYAVDESPATWSSIRPLGMGGAFIAVADDQNALFYNPAGLAILSKWRLALPYLGFETNQSTVDLVKYFIDNQDKFKGELSAWKQSDIDKISNAKIRLNSNVSASFVGRNFGIGLFTVGGARISIGGMFIPTLKYRIDLDTILPVGYAQEVSISELNDFFDANLDGSRLYAGITAKIIRRQKVDDERLAFEFSDIAGKDFNPLEATPMWGYGFDLGFLLKVPTINSNVAFAWRDVYTRIGENSVSPNFGFGYAYRPLGDYLGGIFSDLTFALDINDIFDGDITFFNKVYMGAEIDFIKIFAVRGGFYQGYPSFGLGIGSFLNYATYGVELGKYAGQIEERTHTISLALQF